MAITYIRVKVNSIVKSDQTTKRVINPGFSYTKTYGDSVSTAEITLRRTTTAEDLADFVTGKSVQVWIADALVTGQVAETSANIVFDGYIDDADPEMYQITLKCSDRLVLTKWSETGVKEEYDENEPLKTIFTDLVATAATSTGQTINLSISATATVPANLNRYSTDNNNIYEKLWELSNICNWQFYYDPTDTYVGGGCIRFEPRGTPAEQIFYNKAASTGSPKDQNGTERTWSGKTINVAGIVRWNTDSKDLTNSFNCIGGQTEVVVTSEHHIANPPDYTGGGHFAYFLDDTNAGIKNNNTQIYNITVTANGPVTLIQGVDYTVYEQNTTVGFIDFTYDPSSLYTDLYFTYTYKLSAAAGKSNNDPTSIAAYIKRTKTVTKRNIISPTDISSYITTLLGGFKDPITDVSLESRDALITPVIGSKASVYDGIIGRVLYASGTPVPIITQTTKQWPQPITTVTISTKPLKYENDSQNTYDSVKKLDKEQTETNSKPFFKMDGSTPIQGDVTFGKKSDGTVPQLITPVIHKLTTAPVALTEAQLYYNTTSHTPWFYNGTIWTAFSSGAGGGDVIGPGVAVSGNFASFSSTTGKAIGDSGYSASSFAAAASLANYLPLAGGSGSPLTGDLYIDKVTPGLVLKHSGVIKGYVQATATEFDVYPSGVKMALGDAGQALEEYGSSIVFKTNAIPVTRLTIADAAITAAVPLSMGTHAISGLTSLTFVNGVNTVDFYGYRMIYANATGTDKILRLGTGNAAENATLDRITLSGAATTAIVTILNANLDMKGSIYLMKNHASENTAIVDDANGTMEFYVPAGQKFKFIVSA